MAGMFKALADPVRLRLFSRVAAHQSGEASVCDIQNVGVSQPTVSHHLKKLREAGLIISERRGTWVYCRVAPGVLPAMAQMLSPRESSTDATDAPATRRAADRDTCSPGASRPRRRHAEGLAQRLRATPAGGRASRAVRGPD